MAPSTLGAGQSTQQVRTGRSVSHTQSNVLASSNLLTCRGTHQHKSGHLPAASPSTSGESSQRQPGSNSIRYCGRCAATCPHLTRRNLPLHRSTAPCWSKRYASSFALAPLVNTSKSLGATRHLTHRGSRGSARSGESVVGASASNTKANASELVHVGGKTTHRSRFSPTPPHTQR